MLISNNTFMKIKDFIKDISISFLGCIISAIGIACFLLPNKLSSGGFSGIATIIYYFFKLPMGTSVIMLNIPLFIISYFKLGKRFLLKTFLSTLFFSLCLNTFSLVDFKINDFFLASIYGGMLIGIGMALIFKAKASTGGSDLIAHIINEFNPRFKLGNLLNLLDYIIIGLNLVFFKNVEIGLYSVIAIFINGKMIDLVFEGINFSKVMYIISDKYDELMVAINKDLKLGATEFYGRGMHTKKDKIIIMCVTKRTEVMNIKEIVKKIDKDAFIIISDAREVYGLGFK